MLSQNKYKRQAEENICKEIELAGEDKCFEVVKMLVSAAEEEKINTPAVYDCVITAAAKCGCIEYARKVYQHLDNQKKTTFMTYSRMIVAETEHGSFESVESIYKDAEKAEKINAVINNNFMSAAKKLGCFSSVIETYLKAVNHGNADVGTYKIMILAAGAFRDQKHAFLWAKEA